MAGATGKPLRRVEDPRLVAGRGRYVEDVQPQGVVYLAFVRSPYPNARIIGIDVGEARQAPGVISVATSEDIPELGDVPSIPLPFAKIPPFPPLARGRVAMFGSPVAVVVGESVGAAQDGAELIQVEYDPQPAVASAEAAIQPDAPRVHPEFDSNF